MDSRMIKFRAWNAMREEMVYNACVIDIQGIHGASYSYPLDKWMQFTGLHDKNGKEIWEGDIYKVPNGDIGVIEYDESMFALKCPNGKWAKKYIYWHGGFPCSEEWGVLGNIYENPELIK